MSISGLGDEPPDEPAAPPDHVNVIRAALRDAAANAYPDAHAKQYEDTLVALAAGEVVVVPAEALRALLDGRRVSLDQWRVLAEAVQEAR